jgi:hypothetical protein
MEEKDEKNIWDFFADILNSTGEIYGSYKATTWVDKLLTFLPFFMFLFFMYIIIKGKK